MEIFFLFFSAGRQLKSKDSALWFLAILAERLENGNLPGFGNKGTPGIHLQAQVTPRVAPANRY